MTIIHERVELARQGSNPQVICKLPSGWVVLHEFQTLRGYCLLLSDPVVSSLNELSKAARSQWGLDMILVGDALLAMGAYRINYETWCNQDPALHTHIVPRYLSEPEDLRRQVPGKAYDFTNGPRFSSFEHGPIMQEIRNKITKLT